MAMNIEIPWKIIDKYFKDNPYALVAHHLDSYNDFYKNGLSAILRERNPIKIFKKQDDKTKEFLLQCELYLGGKNADKIYYGKPVIYDDNHEHFMYPNEARLRNMTYGFSIHYDVDVAFKIVTEAGETITTETTLEQIYLGKFPIMLQSNMCVLSGLNSELRFNAGECKSDLGGYFIIDGKEKVIVCQEKFADNMLYIRDNVDDVYSCSAEIKCRSEDASKPVRTTAVKMISPSPTYTNNQIVVIIPNVKKPMPLFIVMRALGVISDKKIIERCILDLDKHESMLELFVPSIHDTHGIYTQNNALDYIKEFTKEKTVVKVLDILSNLFLTHMGELDLEQKSYYLGFMVMKMLKVHIKEESPTDRDNFKYKRVELTGSLLYDLFKEYYTILQNNIYKKIDKEYYFHKGQYQDGNFINLIQNNSQMFFKDRDVETGFKQAFKGNWGAQEHTKKAGVVQDLNRLTFNSALSHRRKLNLPLDASAKVVGPRLLHGSQWGYIDPVDTPDGGNVGLHKHLAISTKITTSVSMAHIIKWLRLYGNIKFLNEANPSYISKNTKIFVNGSWIGIAVNPVELVTTFKYHRRIACIPIYISISWSIDENIIYIYSDAGRLTRPIFYINSNRKLSVKAGNMSDKILNNQFTWDDLITGFSEKKVDKFNKDNNLFYEIEKLYSGVSEESLSDNQAIIDYMDVSEESVSLISIDDQDFSTNQYTHAEIHPSLILGVMGQQIIYPANNQLPRDLFSCGQSKQAVSLYSTNFDTRIDKMGVILNYGQMPLVKSRYLEYINQERNPYGENVIVAIGVYGGYNVEDSILFNQASVDRGMFRTTYFNSYESREESTKVSGALIDSKFCNIQDQLNVVGLKPGYDYNYLDENGIIKENTRVNEKMIVIGKTTIDAEDASINVDASTGVKKGQLGYIDKTFITEAEEGFRIAKVRVRDERIPAIGDKFCSRCGQKGTIGLIIPEESMPFTSDGLKPDIIVNPHALPSRMTIGQFVESLSGKAVCNLGAFGDTTAFVNKGSKHELLGKLLTKSGFNKTGNQILYNGETGEQIQTEYFVGPTYYMRLKHMVKDKINYRAKGPRTVLTRQTVQGRANDGGLRIGEMERDSLISHGICGFLNESMLIRGDEYYMAVCNKSGMLAIYNESKNLFLSPFVDGPIKFVNGMAPFKAGDIEDISKFGRDFSVLRIPYAFKLLIQELGTMNIALRLITEDNIDQLTSMSYSDNVKKLTFAPDSLDDTKLFNQKVTNVTNKQQQAATSTPKAKHKTPGTSEGPATPEGPDTPEGPATPEGVSETKQDNIWSKPMATYTTDIEFKVGDIVTYQSDTLDNRLWTIIKVEGEDIAISTNDLDDLPDEAEQQSGNNAIIMTTKMNLVAYQAPDTVKATPEELGWRYVGGEEEYFESIIVGADGSPSELWFVDDNDGFYPDTNPRAWNRDELVANNITNVAMLEKLNTLRNVPNNWNQSIMELKSSPPYQPNSPPYNPTSPPYNPTSPPYQPNSPPYQPTSPPYQPNSPPGPSANAQTSLNISPLELQSQSPSISEQKLTDMVEKIQAEKTNNSKPIEIKISTDTASSPGDIAAIQQLVNDDKTENKISILKDVESGEESTDTTDDNDTGKKNISI